MLCYIYNKPGSLLASPAKNSMNEFKSGDTSTLHTFANPI